MPVKRMTAKKVRISDLVNGRWEKREGMEPSFVVSPGGEEVSRARIMGTVVSRFLAEEGTFASITIDDSTETIRAKTFKTTKPLDSIDTGSLVEVIGKVREYMGEIYMIPEIVKRIEDPNLELLRELEIIKVKGPGIPGKASKAGGRPASEDKGARGSADGKGRGTEQKKDKDDRAGLKREILKLIGGSEDGIEYAKILENVEGKENDIESVVNEILAEGICYEPTPGRIKKI